MANGERGEVELVVKDQTYTLKLSMNAAAAFEQRSKKTIGEAINKAGELSFTDIRSLLFVLLQKYHKEQFKTEVQVGDMFDDAGGLVVFFDALAELAKMNKASTNGNGTGADGSGTDADGNPQTAPDGTGETSTSAPDAGA